MTDHAIHFAAVGGPDVLKLEPVEVARPGRGEVVVRHTAIGVNFIDTYHRSGLYPLILPTGLGLEAAGVVESLGPAVLDFAVGDRVAYCWGPIGAYATARVIAADRLVAVPDGVSDEIAAAALLKGATTEFLVERCARVEAGQSVLVHAAAGGVGQLLVQWLVAAGARVIATAGSPAKAAIARAAGAEDVILYRDDDVAGAVRNLTAGDGVDVVFDGVGKETWTGSLKSLRRRGLLVSFGNASGPVDNVNLAVLAQNGSLFVTRPTLFDYAVTVDERRRSAAALWQRILNDTLMVAIDQRFPLADAAEAHRRLQTRATTGSTILLP